MGSVELCGQTVTTDNAEYLDGLQKLVKMAQLLHQILDKDGEISEGNGWKSKEVKSGITISTKNLDGIGLTYASSMSLDVPIEKARKMFWDDMPTMHKYLKMQESAEVVHTFNDNVSILRMVTRDFLVIKGREVLGVRAINAKDKNTIYCYSRSFPCKCIPVTAGKVRADVPLSGLKIVAAPGNKSVQVTFLHSMNFDVPVPDAVLIAAATQLLATDMESMKKYAATV